MIKLVERPLRPPSESTKVWYGPIGSGDKLMKSGQKRDKLRDKFNLIGLEMEVAGTMNTIPIGVIQGVCNYSDAQKNKEWQPYAAVMAAALFLIAIKRPQSRQSTPVDFDHHKSSTRSVPDATASTNIIVLRFVSPK